MRDARSLFSVKKIDLLDKVSYLEDLGNAESELRQLKKFGKDLHSRSLLAGVTSGFSQSKFEIQCDSFCGEKELFRGALLTDSYQVQRKRQTFQEISQQLQLVTRLGLSLKSNIKSGEFNSLDNKESTVSVSSSVIIKGDSSRYSKRK